MLGAERTEIDYNILIPKLKLQHSVEASILQAKFTSQLSIINIHLLIQTRRGIETFQHNDVGTTVVMIEVFFLPYKDFG